MAHILITYDKNDWCIGDFLRSRLHCGFVFGFLGRGGVVAWRGARGVGSGPVGGFGFRMGVAVWQVSVGLPPVLAVRVVVGHDVVLLDVVIAGVAVAQFLWIGLGGCKVIFYVHPLPLDEFLVVCHGILCGNASI